MLEQLTNEQIDALFKTYNYSRKQLKSDLEHLKDWLHDQHHLPPSRLQENDCFLEMFLTGCKGSMETAKRKLDAYYTLRAISEDLCHNRDPTLPAYRDILDICHMALLPRPTKQGIRVFISKLVDPDPERFDHVNCTKRVVNLVEMRLRVDRISAGDCVIWDAEHFSAAHVLRLVPSVIRQIIHYGQNVAPIRIQKMIFINSAPFLDVAVNTIAKPFMSKKLRERVILTAGGIEELHKHIDKSVLPKDYGGDYPKTLEEISELWSKRESSLRSWFVNELSEKTDESKRKHVTDDYDSSYFGVQGSLKKLIID